MGNQDQEPKRSELHVDEDWKNRVRAENEALDRSMKDEQPSPVSAEAAGTAQPEPPADDRPASDPGQLPPADFTALMATFSTQAMVALGLIADPATGKAEPELELARYFIDMLGVIETKTDGNLEPNEHAVLESTLHQLRMAFVEVTKQSAQKTGSSS